MLCELPTDYVYNNKTNKSYKAVNETKDLKQANDSCNQDGAILIEHRTVAEHKILDEMFGKCTPERTQVCLDFSQVCSLYL